MPEILYRHMGTFFVTNLLFVPGIDIKRQNMPGIQRLTVRSLDVERRDLIWGKAEALGFVQIDSKQSIDFMGIQCAGIPLSIPCNRGLISSDLQSLGRWSQKNANKYGI